MNVQLNIHEYSIDQKRLVGTPDVERLSGHRAEPTIFLRRDASQNIQNMLFFTLLTIFNTEGDEIQTNLSYLWGML